MEFADGVIRAAWERQGGRCAKCGRWLVWARRGRESVTGAWQPHHKNPGDQEKRDALANCIIFCSGMADCHFNEGHGGVNWSHHASLDDSTLLFLHTGEEQAEKTPKAPAAGNPAALPWNPRTAGAMPTMTMGTALRIATPRTTR